MKKYVIIVVCAATVGLAFGYLGAFIEGWNESSHGAEYSSWKYDWLTYPALPGFIISTILHQSDYQLTEQWIENKHEVAILNGLAFAVVAGLCGKKRLLGCRV